MYTRYGGLVVVGSLCCSADAPFAGCRCQWFCLLQCNTKKLPWIQLPQVYFNVQRPLCRNSYVARCQRQHVLKSTQAPPSLQLPWRVHDMQPHSSARCRCLLVDVVSGHAAAMKLWHVRKGANNALISLISLSFWYCGCKRFLVGLKRKHAPSQLLV